MERSARTLIIIGGKEDRSNQKTILSEVARRVGGGKLVVMLSQGDRVDLIRRAPRQMKGRAAEKLPEKEEETEKVA
jgi:cyanophycinase-like exopeptidase